MPEPETPEGQEPGGNDTPDTPEGAPAAPAAGKPNVDELPEWAQKELAKARGDAAKYRTKAKELEPLAAKAQELEDAGKTETQRLAEAASAAEKRAAEAEAKILRLEVAGEKGLTPAQARRLVGTTKEELEADADELLASFGQPQAPKATPPTQKPTEALRGGTSPDDPPEETDPHKLAALIPRR